MDQQVRWSDRLCKERIRQKNRLHDTVVQSTLRNLHDEQPFVHHLQRTERLGGIPTVFDQSRSESHEHRSKLFTVLVQESSVDGQNREDVQSVSQNKNEKYDPVFRARFPTNEKGDFDGNIYDMQRNEISKTAITNGCFIEAIVELTGIYFIANDFGVSWKLLQLKVKPNNTIRGYAFLEDDSDNDQSDAEPN